MSESMHSQFMTIEICDICRLLLYVQHKPAAIAQRLEL